METERHARASSPLFLIRSPQDDQSFVEVIIPDVLNTYDVIVWAEKESHKILTRRKDASGAIRMLIQP